MRSDRIDGTLRDILHHVDLATEFVAGLDREAFAADLRTVYAATRCLEIISEASRRLPKTLKDRHPAVAWADIAGAGNVYRHDYDALQERRIWNTVRDALYELEAAVRQEIDTLPGSPE